MGVPASGQLTTYSDPLHVSQLQHADIIQHEWVQLVIPSSLDYQIMFCVTPSKSLTWQRCLTLHYRLNYLQIAFSETENVKFVTHFLLLSIPLLPDILPSKNVDALYSQIEPLLFSGEDRFVLINEISLTAMHDGHHFVFCESMLESLGYILDNQFAPIFFMKMVGGEGIKKVIRGADTTRYKQIISEFALSMEGAGLYFRVVLVLAGHLVQIQTDQGVSALRHTHAEESDSPIKNDLTVALLTGSQGSFRFTERFDSRNWIDLAEFS